MQKLNAHLKGPKGKFFLYFLNIIEMAELIVIGNFICDNILRKALNNTVCRKINNMYNQLFLNNLVDKFVNPRLSCEAMEACPKTRKFLNYTDFIKKI